MGCFRSSYSALHGLGLTIWSSNCEIVALTFTERSPASLLSLHWKRGGGFDAKRWNMADSDQAKYTRIDSVELRNRFANRISKLQGDIPGELFEALLARVRPGQQ